MAEYIDRQAAIALAKDIIVPTPNGYDYRHRCIDPQDLAELPAADVVERKRGKWLDGGLDGIGVMGIEYRWQKCSECGSEFSKAPGASYPNYCSMCGADMRGDGDV